MTPLSRVCASSYYYFIETVYLLLFLRHLASNSGVTLKSGLGVVHCD